MNDDHWPAAGKPGRRAGPGTHQQSGGLAALIAASAMGLAACSGHGASSPHVASLGNSSTRGPSPVSIRGHGRGRTATRLSTGNPTRLLDQWAACMRSHGDPNQTDPTVDTSAVIHITTPAGDRDGALPSGQNPTNGKACIKYLAAAQLALRSGRPFPAPPSQGQRVRFSECMRANGVPDFPDPSAGGDISAHPGGDMSPNSPAFQNAARVCARKTGTPGFGGRLPAGAVEVAGGPAGSGVGLIAVGPVSG